MVNPCPDGQVLDKVMKECRPPLKRGRKSGRFSATAKANTTATVKAKTTATAKAKKPCPDGQVLDKATKECRPPLKRGRTSKKSPNKSPKSPPIEVHDNTTLDKYGFAVPVFRPKVYNDAKTYRQTTISFGKRKS
jgi:hypothetical protein